MPRGYYSTGASAVESFRRRLVLLLYGESRLEHTARRLSGATARGYRRRGAHGLCHADGLRLRAGRPAGARRPRAAEPLGRRIVSLVWGITNEIYFEALSGVSLALTSPPGRALGAVPNLRRGRGRVARALRELHVRRHLVRGTPCGESKSVSRRHDIVLVCFVNG